MTAAARNTVVSPSASNPEDEVKAIFNWGLLWRMVDAQIEYLGWTKQQAAEDADVSKSKFSKQEPVNVENLGKLCRWLNLPIDVFLNRDLTAPAQQRYAELIETYASPSDIQRRFDAAFAVAPVAKQATLLGMR